MYPAGKLIALPLRWVHKGTMFWVKSQKRVNIFRKSKVLMFLNRKMMNRKDQIQKSVDSRGCFS